MRAHIGYDNHAFNDQGFPFLSLLPNPSFINENPPNSFLLGFCIHDMIWPPTVKTRDVPQTELETCLGCIKLMGH